MQHIAHDGLTARDRLPAVNDENEVARGEAVRLLDKRR